MIPDTLVNMLFIFKILEVKFSCTLKKIWFKYQTNAGDFLQNYDIILPSPHLAVIWRRF